MNHGTETQDNTFKTKDFQASNSSMCLFDEI